MGAIRLVFRAELRQRWRSWIALGLLVGLVGGAVLAAVVAGRRTADAFPRFVAAHGYDTAVYAFEPLPNLSKFPEVASVTAAIGPANGTPTCTCTGRPSPHVVPLSSNNFGIQEIAWAQLPRVVKLVSGRFPHPDAPWEVLAPFTAQRDLGMGIGSVLRVPLFGTSQTSAITSNGAGITPTGPTVDLRVVGIEASIGDFPSGSASYQVYTTPAFGRVVNSRTLTANAYYVRLRHGPADQARFSGDTSSLGGAFGQDLDNAAANVQSSLHPEAVGWWVLALVAGLAGLAIAGQAVARQAIVSSDNFPTLAALGTRPRQLAAVGITRTAVIGVAGGVVSVVLAAALSPLTPVGEARIADPSPGFSLDPLVLPLGALGVVVAVVALGLWPAIRAARPTGSDAAPPPARPSHVVAALARAGAPPAAVIGVRHALERGRGRGAVPVGTALLGTALALTALCGTAVFGASLSHLASTPNLYGDEYQVWFNGGGSAVRQVNLLPRLQHDSAVRRITLGVSSEYQVNGVNVAGVAGTPIEGAMLVTAIDGHLPAGDGQIALGHTTMRQVGARIGSTVRVAVPVASGGTRTAAFRVVGTSSFPPDFPGGGLGRGAVLTIGGLEDASCPVGPGRSACRAALEQTLNFVLLVGTSPGPSGRAAVARYIADYPGLAALPQTPADLVNFGQAVNFPLILGVALGVFGAATLLHLLVVNVTRRRREMGLLKALGFVPRQLGATVCWQATTIAVVGTVIGVPVGIAAGHVVWRAFASNLGFVAVPFVTAWVIVVLGLGALVLANVFALGPALAAGRGSAGALLRTE